MVEPEVAFMEFPELCSLAEEFVCFLVTRVLERCQEPLKLLERDTSTLEKVTEPFPRLTYSEAIEALQEAGQEISWGEDFGGEHETILAAQFDRPVLVTHYPAAIKAFYMEPDPERPSSLSPSMCWHRRATARSSAVASESTITICSCSGCTEHDLPVEAFQWYLDVRKYGTFPHSGFGMGLERFVAWVCGLKHLRETIPYPRMLYRIYP